MPDVATVRIIVAYRTQTTLDNDIPALFTGFRQVAALDLL